MARSLKYGVKIWRELDKVDNSFSLHNSDDNEIQIRFFDFSIIIIHCFSLAEQTVWTKLNDLRVPV